MAKQETAEINDTLALLAQNQEPDVRQLNNIVLFVGMTGSGKSTLCQFLGGNPNLVAKKDGGSSDLYISDGDDKVSDSTTVSKHLSPEILSIFNTTVVLADCPGFANTRSPQHDIAAAMSTKQLLDKAENVKIVIVTPHHAVRDGGENTAFRELLQHFSSFIKDIEKFRDSIVLMVTKVEMHSYGSDLLVEDYMVIEQIKLFLASTKAALENGSFKDDQVKQQLILLDILCGKNNSKIGLFRRPIRVEPVNSSQLLIEERAVAIDLIAQQMNYTQVRSSDFGLTLSENSKLMVRKWQQTVKKNQANIVNKHLADISSMLSLKIDEDKAVEDVKETLKTLNMLIEFCERENAPKLEITLLFNGTKPFQTQYPTVRDEWLTQQKFARFLGSIVGDREDLKPVNDFDRHHIRLNGFQEKLLGMKSTSCYQAELLINQSIYNTVADIMADMSGQLESKNTTSYFKLADTSINTHKILEQFSHKSANDVTFQHFVAKFASTLQDLHGLHVSPSQWIQLLSLEAEIAFMNANADPVFLDGQQNEWFKAIKSSLLKFNSIAEWYTYVSDLETELSSYDKQSGIFRFQPDFKDWENFRTLVPSYYTLRGRFAELMQAKFPFDAKQQRVLDSLTKFMSTQPTYTCESTVLMVTGNFIRISQVIELYIPKCVIFKELYLFAAQTLFIDESLNAAGKNVYLMAPIWHILGAQKINLKGQNGAPTTSLLSIKSGRPGGNFVGVGEQFINEQNLTVDVSGGHGAWGIDGADGAHGFDGKTYEIVDIQRHDWGCGRTSSWKFKNFSPSEYRFNGSKGAPGANGRDGSQPGFGGKSGRVTIRKISNEPLQVKLIQHDGMRGWPGRGGRGGIGGHHGKDRIFKCSLFPIFKNIFSFRYEKRFETIDLCDMGKAADGRNGRDGVAGTPEISAEPAPYQPLVTVAGHYKQHFERNSLEFGNTRSFWENNLFNPVSGRSKRSIFQIPPVLMTHSPNSTLASKNLLTTDAAPSLSCANFSLSTLVQLMDLVARKLWKTHPPTSSDTSTEWDRLLVQAEVLQIVEQCELEYNEQHGNNSNDGHFDPLPLLNQLKQLQR